MSSAPFYRLRDTTGDCARLGLVVLQVDETLEQDMRRLLPQPDLALYVSRIPSGADLTTDSIAQMAHDLPAAAALLPQSAPFDAVGYGCTSGTTLIGADKVADLVREGCSAQTVCDPLSAAITACRALDLHRIALVSPYTADVADPMRRAFVAAGIAVPHATHFGEATEAHVARIDPASLVEAARQAAVDVDGVFISCTNLRTLDIIAPLEADLGMPVLSSNLVLAWAMARAAGLSLHGPATRLR